MTTDNAMAPSRWEDWEVEIISAFKRGVSIADLVVAHHHQLEGKYAGVSYQAAIEEIIREWMDCC